MGRQEIHAGYTTRACIGSARPSALDSSTEASQHGDLLALAVFWLGPAMDI